MTANRLAMTAKPIRFDRMVNSTAVSFHTPSQKLARMAMAALTTSDTISRKASTSTRPNDSRRVRSMSQAPASFKGGTCQISSRLAFSSANTLVAPNSSRALAMRVAMRPCSWFFAPASTS
ncbi:hypothetical protein D3C72_1756010 [compost metagenome]